MKKSIFTVCALALLLMLLAFSPVNAQAEDGGLTFTAQPEDVDVNYPDGAEFHVEVSDPDLVESYQWIYNDGTQDFVLTGTTAYTDTLIIPCTAQDSHDAYLRCVITDKDGNEIESDAGCMHIAKRTRRYCISATRRSNRANPWIWKKSVLAAVSSALMKMA